MTQSTTNTATVSYYLLDPVDSIASYRCYFPEHLISLFCFTGAASSFAICTLFQSPLNDTAAAILGFISVTHSFIIQLIVCSKYRGHRLTGGCNKLFASIDSYYKDLSLITPPALLTIVSAIIAYKTADPQASNATLVLLLLTINLSVGIINFNLTTGRSVAQKIPLLQRISCIGAPQQ